jgi:tetratricopeptide (TPR) repeat protein
MITTNRTSPWPSPADPNDVTAAATGDNLGADDGGGDNDECKIPRSALLRVLQGVAVATKTSDDDTKPVVRRILSCRIPRRGGTSNSDAHNHNHNHNHDHDHDDTAAALSLSDWRAAIVSDLPEEEEESRQLASLTLGVAFLREKCRQGQGATVAAVTAADLALVYGLIHGALTSPLLTRPLCSASRSAQGFLAVPLCSLVKDGCIDELFRLHVWLPDGQRGNPEFAIHSHQPFAQSWILAGEGKDHSYKVEPAADPPVATHAEYALAWNDGKNLSTTYKTHQSYSIVVNTEMLVRATPTNSAVHTRDMSYSIPEAAFHRTEVSPDILHATLFFFDSHRGFVKDARVLGPKDAESFIQPRDPAGVTPAALASMVDAVRSWEIFMGQGQQHAQRAEWEHALRAFNSALNLCESVENFPNPTRYRHLVLGELGNTNRRFGRYEQAKDILERALAEMGPSLQRVEFSGELGVVYRHMNRFVDAKHAFEIQYNTAKQLKFERAMCRAVGNLGMVNYQLSQQNHDDALLELAIKQLIERVQSARQIKEAIDTQATDSNTKAHWRKDATTWESIGLSRLSLCYAARGNAKEAIAVALEALNITSSSEDSTVIAVSRFFYGRALLLDGQREEALRQFNPHKACTPAIAFCKEPSEEHLQYLRELVEAGADMDLVDEQGYTALDYAVFSGDTATEELVLEGLRQRLDGDVEHKLVQRQTEAKLRKGYRELFQEKLRPVLLGGGGGDGLQNLRRVYADALAADKEKRSMFDGLKFVRYSDFLHFGKLPRSSDNLVQQFMPESSGNYQDGTAEFVIFFSYRWINKDPRTSSPDDTKNTQYRRMVRAAEEFLRLHPSVDRERLRIWLVGQNKEIYRSLSISDFTSSRIMPASTRTNRCQVSPPCP